MGERKVRVAMVGLGFGAEFLPIYQDHPNAEIAAICRRDEKGLNEVGDRLGIETRYTDYEKLLADPEVDFVHINSPIPDHGWMGSDDVVFERHRARLLATLEVSSSVGPSLRATAWTSALARST